MIGSHGQTIFHQSDPGDFCGQRIASTLQIGEAAVLVEETGVTTVSDFRPSDMAAGGTGAPLIPLVDFLLFRDLQMGRVLLNLGGIANLTLLPPACGISEIRAFDSGPGNMVIDALVRRLGRDPPMPGDAWPAPEGPGSAGSSAGHPYFRRKPPKSAGREQRRTFVEGIWRRRGRPPRSDRHRFSSEATQCWPPEARHRWDRMLVSAGASITPI